MAQAETEVVGREAELQALAGFLDRSSALPGRLPVGRRGRHRQDDAVAPRHRARLGTLVPRALVQPFRVGDPALLRRARRPARGCPRGGSYPAAGTSAARSSRLRCCSRYPDGPPPDQLAVARAFLGALRALAHDGDVALAVDDVQWLDPSSAFVLEFALRRLREERVAALFGLRSSQDQAALGLERALPEGRLQRLMVGPLSLGAVRHLLSARLGLVLSRPKLRRLHEISGGNPFYALELARAFERRISELEAGEVSPRDTRDARRGEARGSSRQDAYRPARRVGVVPADPRGCVARVAGERSRAMARGGD